MFTFLVGVALGALGLYLYQQYKKYKEENPQPPAAA